MPVRSGTARSFALSVPVRQAAVPTVSAAAAPEVTSPPRSRALGDPFADGVCATHEAGRIDATSLNRPHHFGQHQCAGEHGLHPASVYDRLHAKLFQKVRSGAARLLLFTHRQSFKPKPG